jgi:hypothetical protein
VKKQADSSNSARRAFLRGAGAVAAAFVPGAAATVLAGNAGRTHDDAAAIRKLYRDYTAGLPARRAEPGAAMQLKVLHDPSQPEDAIEVASGGQSARASFHCLVQTATPLAGRGPSLLEMARLQGQHHDTSWEAGVHELDCVKLDGQWTIRRLTYRKAGPVTPR